MASRIVSLLLIVFMGFMLYQTFRYHLFAILIAVSTLACSIAAILPNKFQDKSSYIVKSFTLLTLTFGLLLLFQRIYFIYVNGGIEGPNGEGSPIAFLIGVIYEQVLFTAPSLFILWVYSNKRIRMWQSS